MRVGPRSRPSRPRRTRPQTPAKTAVRPVVVVLRAFQSRSSPVPRARVLILNSSVNSTLVRLDGRTGTTAASAKLFLCPRDPQARMMSLAANVAGGNLLLESHDFKVDGTGLELLVDRHYNNLLQTEVSGGRLEPRPRLDAVDRSRRRPRVLPGRLRPTSGPQAIASPSTRTRSRAPWILSVPKTRIALMPPALAHTRESVHRGHRA